MRRRLFNLAAAVSLGMMLAAVAMWVWSYWRVAELRRQRWKDCSVDTFYVLSGSGGCRIGTVSVASNDTAQSFLPKVPHLSGWQASSEPGALAVSGVGLSRGAWSEGSMTYTVWTMRVPDWMILLPTTVLPSWWTIAMWKRWRSHLRWVRRGRCTTCGYDLRATPDRCPECGTTVQRGPRGLLNSGCDAG